MCYAMPTTTAAAAAASAVASAAAAAASAAAASASAAAASAAAAHKTNHSPLSPESVQQSPRHLLLRAHEVEGGVPAGVGSVGGVSHAHDAHRLVGVVPHPHGPPAGHGEGVAPPETPGREQEMYERKENQRRG